MSGDCVVCGAPGTGVFFGARTCESCRAFFKQKSDRDVAELRKGDCEGKCPVTKEVRKCWACRMQKCLDAGMDLKKSKMAQWKKVSETRKGTSTKTNVKTPTSKSQSDKANSTPASGKKSKLSLKGSKGSKTPSGNAKSITDSWKTKPRSSPGEDKDEERECEAEAEVREEDVEEAKVPCVASLYNLGNTCFLNSVVQVLRYTSDFTEQVEALDKQIKVTEKEKALIAKLNEKPEMAEDDNDEDIMTWDLVKNLNKVFNKMCSTEERFMTGSSEFIGVRPYDLLDTVERLNPMFQGNLQQDAHEFLRCLLAYVQDASRELNKYRNRAKNCSGTHTVTCDIRPEIFAPASEVEMLGGCQDAKPVGKSRGKKDCAVEVKQRSSKRLSGGKVRNENNTGPVEHVVKPDAEPLTNGFANGHSPTDVKSPPTKRPTRKRNSLTELQNQDLSSNGQKSMDSFLMNTNASANSETVINRDPVKQECTESCDDHVYGEDNGKQKPSKRLSTKRKAEDSADDNKGDNCMLRSMLQAEESDDLPAIDESDIENALKKRKRSVENHNKSSPGSRESNHGNKTSPGSRDSKLRIKRYGITRPIMENGTAKSCAGEESEVEETSLCPEDEESQGHTEHGQGDCFTVTAMVKTKVPSDKKQTARKTFGAAKQGQSTEHKGPFAIKKEAVVRLDKNGITNYFAKICKPQSIDDIQCDLEPVDDCIEKLFQGQMALRTRCCECESITERKEDYQDISVAVRNIDHEDDPAWSRLRKDGEGKDGKGKDDEGKDGEGKDGEEKDEAVQENGETAELGAEILLQESVVQDGSEEGSVDRCKENDKSVKDTSTEELGTEKESFSWIKKSLGEVECLRDNNKYYCDRCLHLVEAARSMHYTSVPSVLTLHLKRFAMSQSALGGFTKLKDHVPLPMLLPCIEDHCTEPDKHRLQLYGVITHTGYTLSCGHYTAYVRAPDYSPALYDPDIIAQTLPKTSQDSADCKKHDTDEATVYWFECDDEIVTVLREEDFLAKVAPGHETTHTPYLLFYQRT